MRKDLASQSSPWFLNLHTDFLPLDREDGKKTSQSSKNEPSAIQQENASSSFSKD